LEYPGGSRIGNPGSCISGKPSRWNPGVYMKRKPWRMLNGKVLLLLARNKNCLNIRLKIIIFLINIFIGNNIK
jgi:hypothetical protein